MFDVGFSELLLLAIVALVVIGPERLPHAARVAGAWIGRIKRTVSNIQADIEREVSAQELRDRLEKEIALVREHDAMSGVSEPFEAVQQGLASLQDEARQFGQPHPVTATTPPQPSILPPAAATGVTLAELTAAAPTPVAATAPSAERPEADTATAATQPMPLSTPEARTDDAATPASPIVDGEAAYREWLAAQKSPNLGLGAAKEAAIPAAATAAEPLRHD
ncbi:MAG: Sec-independent protein translocase protein TatB [Moraxellaceae bacterium]|nr:Sec-independent protein translocase protein TatB [Moraxellaceae bacterium]